MEDLMQLQMYSTRKLDRDLRKDFCLPADPYSEDGAEAERAQKYLRSLGVVFYRDDRYGDAVIVEPDDEDETSILDRSGWLGFKSSCIISKKSGAIIPWPISTKRSRANSRKLQKQIEKSGDDRSWLIWNRSCVVQKMTEMVVVAE